MPKVFLDILREFKQQPLFPAESLMQTKCRHFGNLCIQKQSDSWTGKCIKPLTVKLNQKMSMTEFSDTLKMVFPHKSLSFSERK
jgi:hypothetical protein